MPMTPQDELPLIGALGHVQKLGSELGSNGVKAAVVAVAAMNAIHQALAAGTDISDADLKAMLASLPTP